MPQIGLGIIFAGRSFAEPAPTAPSAFADADWSLADPQTDGDLTLEWFALPDDGGSAITDVEYRVDGGAPVSTGSTASSDSVTISGLVNDVQVAVEIRAVNAVDADPNNWSIAKSATPTNPADSTAPILSSPTDAANGANAATGGVTTDEDNETLFWVVLLTADSTPSGPQVIAGTKADDSPAEASGSQPVSATGVQTLSPAPTGLAVLTGYKIAYAQRDAANNVSNVVVGDGFTTAGTRVSYTGAYTVETGDIGAVAQKVLVCTGSGDLEVEGDTLTGIVDSGIIDSGAPGGRGQSAGPGGGGSGCGPETVTRNETLTAGTYPVVVGAAVAGPSTNSTAGSDGNQSSFNSHVGGGVGKGGGRDGNTTTSDGKSGVCGSGGGALSGTPGVGGTGTTSNGTAGTGSATGTERAGGAGGGAGGNAGASSINNGGDGGAPLTSTLLDSDTLQYGAGGGGPGAFPGLGGDGTANGGGGTNGGAAGAAPTLPGSASGGCRGVQPASSTAGLVRVCVPDDPAIEVVEP